MLNFFNNHLLFKSQLAERTPQVRNHLQSNFSLLNQVDVVLDVVPPDAGQIRISTVTPDTYPWQGVYFNGIPVKIEALPKPGYTFLNWGSNRLISDTLNPVFNDTLTAYSTDFTAYFANFTSTGTFLKESGLVMYPNPAKDKLNLISNSVANYSNLSFRIIDLNGRTMSEGTMSMVNRKSEIDIHALPPAVYLLRIVDKNETLEQFRFIKMR